MSSAAPKGRGRKTSTPRGAQEGSRADAPLADRGAAVPRMVSDDSDNRFTQIFPEDLFQAELQQLPQQPFQGGGDEAGSGGVARAPPELQMVGDSLAGGERELQELTKMFDEMEESSHVDVLL